MSLRLELPEEFINSLQKSVEVVYSNAIETARRDVGIIREYLTIDEACELMSISRNTLIRQYLEKGLPKYVIGNRQYVKREELNEFVEKHEVFLKKQLTP